MSSFQKSEELYVAEGRSSKYTLFKKRPYQHFYWSVFSRIQNEYRDLPCKSRYSVQVRENTDQKISKSKRFLRSDECILRHDVLGFMLTYVHSVQVLQSQLRGSKWELSTTALLDRWPLPEGSYKIGFVLLSISFIGIGSLVLSEIQHGVRGSYTVLNSHWSKMVQRQGFWTF